MKDWHRREILRALMVLIEENLMTYKDVAIIIEAYDEKKESQDVLKLALNYEDEETPVSLNEAMGEVLGDLPSRRVLAGNDE